MDSTTEAEFDQVYAIHVKGPFFLAQSLLSLLDDGGRIVNLSSAPARVAFPGSGPYDSAKAAIEALTRCQAVEFGARGITANVVASGAVPDRSADRGVGRSAALADVAGSPPDTIRRHARGIR